MLFALDKRVQKVIQYLASMWRPAKQSGGHLHVFFKIQLFNPKFI